MFYFFSFHEPTGRQIRRGVSQRGGASQRFTRVVEKLQAHYVLSSFSKREREITRLFTTLTINMVREWVLRATSDFPVLLSGKVCHASTTPRISARNLS